jgi:protein-S-isoprenylcysteine O-methyltransferase Ste14
MYENASNASTNVQILSRLNLHLEHRLITMRFYAHMWHPAYTGSLLLVVGLAFSYLTRCAWMTKCGPLRFVARRVP